jgi:hypothetical protein
MISLIINCLKILEEIVAINAAALSSALRVFDNIDCRKSPHNFVPRKFDRDVAAMLLLKALISTTSVAIIKTVHLRHHATARRDLSYPRTGASQTFTAKHCYEIITIEASLGEFSELEFASRRLTAPDPGSRQRGAEGGNEGG